MVKDAVEEKEAKDVKKRRAGGNPWMNEWHRSREKRIARRRSGTNLVKPYKFWKRGEKPG